MSVSVLYLIALVFASQTLALNDVLVKNLRLYVNCEEFFVKSFCYSPTPLGASMAPNGLGGLCSWRIDQTGANVSACSDSDFFDGGAGHNPAVLPDGWFTSMWARDMPIMKEMGANTIRIYHANPYTKAYTQTNNGTNGVVLPYGKSHVEFFDMAAANDLKVIWPLPGEYEWLMNYSEELMYQLIRNMVDEVGNHSALLMWAIGNELPLDDNLIGIINKYANYSRYYTQQKWNRFIPVTHAVNDYPPAYNHLVESLAVDVFSANAGYRGLGFQDLWTGNPGQNFSGFKNLSATYNKPLFISEIGWMSANNSIDYSIPNWFNQIIADLFNYVDDGCVGYAFFEFTDEATKGDPLQKTMGVIGLNTAIVGDQNSGDPNVYLADIAYKKPIIFEAVMNGTFNGKNFNMLEDVWTLLNRTRSTLPSSQCVISPPSPSMVTTGNATTTSTGSSVTTSTTGSTVTSTTTGSVTSTTSSSTTGSTGSTTGQKDAVTTTNHNESFTSSASVLTGAFSLVVAILVFLL